MRWGDLTDDELDRVIVEAEVTVARARADQMGAIREQHARRTHTRDGHRSLTDWVAARADVSLSTARRLCWTASRLADAPDVEGLLADGDVSFDRAEQLARLPDERRENHVWFDIGQLRRQAALHRKLTRREESETATRQCFNIRPTVDETGYKTWGEFDGLAGTTIEKAVDQRADELTGDDRTLGLASRRAIALVAICQDSLCTDDSASAPPVEVTVTVDARSAVDSNGETGVAVLNGPKIARQALDAVVCDATVQVMGTTETGRPLDMGRKTRTVPPALRRRVLDRDGGCTVEGCSSRYRLQAHHSIPWSKGGATDEANLITVCWYHHHVIIHRWGYTIDRIGRSRVRLERPDTTDPP